MPDRNIAQNLTQKTIDLLETASCFCRKAAMKCHIVGLQGEKRRMRYLYRKCNNIADSMQHGVYDIFSPGLELYPNTGNTDITMINSPQTCMKKMIDTLWAVHDQLHLIANDMVIQKMKGLSGPLYDYCSCLMSMLGEMQRNYRSYEAGGWEYHHISRHQESACNIHDEYEDKEGHQGYSDHKEA
jgi:hypothetical protein